MGYPNPYTNPQGTPPCGLEQETTIMWYNLHHNNNLGTDSTPELKKNHKKTSTPFCNVALKKGGVHHVAAATKDCIEGHTSIT